jgi:hypothetical protein
MDLHLAPAIQVRDAKTDRLSVGREQHGDADRDRDRYRSPHLTDAGAKTS